MNTLFNVSNSCKQFGSQKFREISINLCFSNYLRTAEYVKTTEQDLKLITL